MTQTAPFKGLLVLVLLVAGLFPALAQTNVDLNFGIQDVDVDGHEGVYRSHFNDDGGLLIRALHLDYALEEGSRDYFRLDAEGFSATPYGRLQFRIDRHNWFHLKMTFRRMDHFSALPQIANPFLADGVSVGQHTVDRVRETLKLSLDLLPNAVVQPFVEFHRNTYDGPATTSYHFGQDEFPMATQLDETEETLTFGLRYSNKNFHAHISQGYRDFRGSETWRLQPGAGSGNNTGILGTDIFADQLGRELFMEESSTPVTQAGIAAHFGHRVQLRAGYSHADLDLESTSFETFAGSFASFRINRFFNGGNATVVSRTESPTERGHLEVNFSITDNLDLELRHGFLDQDLDGTGIAEMLYLNTVTLGGTASDDAVNLAYDFQTHMSRDETDSGLRLEYHGGNQLRFFASASVLDADVDVSQDLAEIVLPEGQGGSFNREVERFSFGAGHRGDRHSAHVEYTLEDADTTVVRTDFTQRNSLRVMLRFQLMEGLHLNARGLQRDSENDTPGINLDMDLTDAGVDLDIGTSKKWGALLSYGIFELDSDIRYRDPYFDDLRSIHEENGDRIEARGWVNFGRAKLNGGYSEHDNEGVVGYTLERLDLGLDIKISEDFSLQLEAATVEYDETLLPLANYDADRYALLISWRN